MENLSYATNLRQAPNFCRQEKTNMIKWSSISMQ